MPVKQPIFENEYNEEFTQKVNKLVTDKVTEMREKEKKTDVQSRLEEIKKSIISTPLPPAPVTSGTGDHVHDFNGDCPTCKGHTLKVNGDEAKCTGPGCGLEYLLVPKIKDLNRGKKKYLCTTCGASYSREEIERIKNKDNCPTCNSGKSVLEINWDLINKEIQNTKGLRKVF